MRQKVELTDNQKQELDDFYEYCVVHRTNFESYSSICTQAKLFEEKCKQERTALISSIALLAFSALVRYRKDDLFDVMKRDFSNSISVRLRLLEGLYKEK